MRVGQRAKAVVPTTGSIGRLVLALLIAFQVTPAAQRPPTIAAAANLNFALTEIAKQFERVQGSRVEVVFGASGTLTRQIQDGAPFELFLAADEEFPNQLSAAGLTRDAGVVYAVGRLALFAPTGSPLAVDERLDGLSAREAGGVTRFAIANPDVAPYGRAAEAVLRKRGLWDALRPRLVLGDSITQAAQFATTGNAVGGLLAYSLVLSPGLRRPRHLCGDSGCRSPAAPPAHGAARSAPAPSPPQFYAYVQGAAARAILSEARLRGARIAAAWTGRLFGSRSARRRHDRHSASVRHLARASAGGPPVSRQAARRGAGDGAARPAARRCSGSTCSSRSARARRSARPSRPSSGSRLPFSFEGLLLASAIANIPFVVQPIQRGFEAIPTDVRDAAACCGLTPWQRFLRIEVPLAWPSILTAAILTFAHTLGEFGVVLMVGGNLPGETRTLSVAIYDRMQAFDDRSAGVMAATLLVIAVATLMATTALSRRVGPRRG